MDDIPAKEVHQDIVPNVPIDIVIPVPAVDVVIASAAIDRVVHTGPADGVIPAAGEDQSADVQLAAEDNLVISPEALDLHLFHARRVKTLQFTVQMHCDEGGIALEMNDIRFLRAD